MISFVLLAFCSVAGLVLDCVGLGLVRYVRNVLESASTASGVRIVCVCFFGGESNRLVE